MAPAGAAAGAAAAGGPGPVADREAVFQTMEGFARSGGLILFISHRMDEVMRLADRVTILRNGRVVDTLERAAVSPELMLKLMAPAAAEELSHGH